jgi:hypothetical protein
MNYDCTTHPILPFIKITTKFLSKHYTEMNGYHCFNFTEKLSYDMCFTLKLPQGEVHDFSGEVQNLLGEVQNDRKGGAK